MTEQKPWAVPVLTGVGLLSVVVLIVIAFGGAFLDRRTPGAMEVRFAVPAHDPTAEECRDLEGGIHFLGPAERFELSSVFETTDLFGSPAVGFVVGEDQRDRFRELTADHIGEPMAMLAGGWVLTIPVLEEELPGYGVFPLPDERTIEHILAMLTMGH